MTLAELESVCNSRIYVNTNCQNVESGFLDEMSEEDQFTLECEEVRGIYADNDPDLCDPLHLYVYL